MATYTVDPAVPVLRARRNAAAGRAGMFALIAAACWWFSRPAWPALFDLGTAGALECALVLWTVWRFQRQIGELRGATFEWTDEALRMTTPARSVVIPRAELKSVIDGSGFVVSSTVARRFIHVPPDVVGGDQLRRSLLETGVVARPARAETLKQARAMTMMWLGLIMLFLSRSEPGRVASAVTMVVSQIWILMLRRRTPKDPAVGRLAVPPA